MGLDQLEQQYALAMSIVDLTNKIEELVKRVSTIESQVRRLHSIKQPRPVEYSSLFLEWYKHYPRKIDKKEAQRAWNEMLPKFPPIADLTVATDNFAKAMQDRDPKYTPHPSTWLRREGWEEDEARPRPVVPMSGRLSVERTMTRILDTPEGLINQQAPDWAYHRSWGDYAQAVTDGKTRAVFPEWAGLT